jgi:uncharacterized protein DUF6602
LLPLAQSRSIGEYRVSQWSLSKLLAGLHDDIQKRLEISRSALGHAGTKGDASENVWLALLQLYLPQRYEAASAHVVDSEGEFSEQIDVVIFDRQYSPFIFKYEGQTIIPAESVYGAFEAKQTIGAELVEYAHKKIASVRRLHRTTLPIPHAGGTFPPKSLIPILGGILTFESDWSPPFGQALDAALAVDMGDGRLDFGCVAAHGHFHYETDKKAYNFTRGGRPATAFLFNLISRLQFSGTVPMIDIQAYARWLAK